MCIRIATESKRPDSVPSSGGSIDTYVLLGRGAAVEDRSTLLVWDFEDVDAGEKSIVAFVESMAALFLGKATIDSRIDDGSFRISGGDVEVAGGD